MTDGRHVYMSLDLWPIAPLCLRTLIIGMPSSYFGHLPPLARPCLLSKHSILYPRPRGQSHQQQSVPFTHTLYLPMSQLASYMPASSYEPDPNHPHPSLHPTAFSCFPGHHELVIFRPSPPPQQQQGSLSITLSMRPPRRPHRWNSVLAQNRVGACIPNGSPLSIPCVYRFALRKCQ